MQRVVLQSTLEMNSNWNTMQPHSDIPSVSMHTTLDFFLGSGKTAVKSRRQYYLCSNQSLSRFDHGLRLDQPSNRIKTSYRNRCTGQLL